MPEQIAIRSHRIDSAILSIYHAFLSDGITMFQVDIGGGVQNRLPFRECQ